MSLLEKIEKLQKSPESYRRKILAFLMIIIIPAILSVWFFTLNFSFVGSNKKKVEIQPPFALVFDGFTETYSVFKDKILSLKSINN